MTFKLPPLSAVRLFETAARLLSFKAAAEELHVTPSAVSHGVRTLEDWLGVELFVRGRRSLSLTEAGERFLRPVQQAFVALFPTVGALTLFAPSLIVTLLVAALSWHLVEKPALGLKRRLLKPA